MRVLEDIAGFLGKDGEPVELCLIGSAVCILAGMEGRTSVDLNVWSPCSNFDELELKHATSSAGLLFDPKSNLPENTAYIQIVELGLTQLGTFTGIALKRMGRLHITRPPYENLIAAKLIRGHLKDIQDIQYLMQNFTPDKAEITRIVGTLPERARIAASENLIYLEVFK